MEKNGSQSSVIMGGETGILHAPVPPGPACGAVGLCVEQARQGYNVLIKLKILPDNKIYIVLVSLIKCRV